MAGIPPVTWNTPSTAHRVPRCEHLDSIKEGAVVGELLERLAQVAEVENAAERAHVRSQVAVDESRGLARRRQLADPPAERGQEADDHRHPPSRTFRRCASTVSSYRRRVASTQRSHRKRRSTRSRLADPNFARSARSPSSRARRSTKLSGRAGSQTKPPSPSTTSSGSEPRSDTTTGTPADIASPTVSPKPSRADGKRKTSARLKCAALAASGTYPVKITLSRSPS